MVDNGVKSLVPFPEEPCHTGKRPFLCCTARLRVRALMSWPGCRSSSREASWSWSPDLMEHGGGWQRAEESGAGCVPGALVGLTRLHLQQSQHGRVVSKFHPPLGGQAHVLSQVVYGSCTGTKRQEKNTHTRQTGGRFLRHMSYSLSFHFSD